MDRYSEGIQRSAELRATLSKLCPIERWMPWAAEGESNPLAPQFFWSFFQVPYDDWRRLVDALRRYVGLYAWSSVGSIDGMHCVTAFEPGFRGITGYPPGSGRGAGSGEMETLQPRTRDFIAGALADVPNLCRHLERDLGLEGRRSLAFDASMAAPSAPRERGTPPIDFVEPGTHVPRILDSDQRTLKVLHFSLNDDEWRAIDEIDGARRVPGVRSERFPLLAEIDPYDSAMFAGEQVQGLRAECVRARSEADVSAIRGLDKLIMICDWGLYLEGEVSLGGP